MRRAANLAEPLDRLRQSELLAAQPRHEPAAANLAARLESAIYARKLPPRRGRWFASDQAPAHDAVAAQVRPRERIDPLVGRAVGLSRRAADERPSAGDVRATRTAWTGRRRPHQRAQAAEPVRGDSSRADEAAERRLEV